MRLFIAEKPSLGRAIAQALPQPLQRGDGFIKAANGDVVSWCIGHLLEQAEPEAYDPNLKKWSLAQLPIIPSQWQLQVKKQTSKQFTILKKWIKQADQLIHAGDPDREGQLLVDEVISFAGVSKAKRDQTQRCLISDLNLPAIKRSLANLRSNREFIPLSVSALARSRADWLYGINLTRAYTLQGQKAGYQGVLSVGRVQTPILGLVVKRDNDIQSFVSVDYYDVWANLYTKDNAHFRAKWLPSTHCAPYLDDQGRNLSLALAQNVAQRTSFQPAKVEKLNRKKKSLAAPLPYNLSALQMDANRIFGFSAQQVLDICQALYEQHKAITYPRSDSRHLPLEHLAQADKVLPCIKSNLDNIDNNGPLSFEQSNALLFQSLKPTQKSKAWNDAKVDAHHAIIPTQKKLTQLTDAETKIYRLVARNYIAQFLPNYIYFESTIEINIAKGKFIARANELVQQGWKPLFSRKPDSKSSNKSDSKSNNNQNDDEQLLPTLTEGEQLESKQADILSKKTSPPKHFTDASLLAAMTGINAFVKNTELKKILKDTDGLGTEATRAGIIELLFKRGFMARTGKTIKATETGKALITALPESITLPDRTAQWEATLSAICEHKAKYETLMNPLQTELYDLIAQSQHTLPTGLAGLKSNSTSPKRKYGKARKGLKKKAT